MIFNHNPIHLIFLILFLLLFGTFSHTVAAQQDPPTGAQPLFVETNLSGDGGELDAPEVMRGRYVTINANALASTTSAPASTIELNLFEDEYWTAVQIRVESNLSGSYTWLGELAGVPHSSVILIVRDGLVTGKVALLGDIYTIVPIDDNLHVIAQVDPHVIDPETQIDFILPPVDDTSGTSDSEVAVSHGMDILTASDDGKMLDLLVLYTDDARIERGSTEAIESLIELGVAESNRAYEQSGVTQRLYLVHMEEVNHTESSNSVDLNRFINTSDGQLDIVHTLRNTYHADFSKLVVNTSGCGIAALQTTVGGDPDFENLAFSVTDESCISPNYTFAHELGHNMGLRHDWYVDPDVTPYTYAHGYADRSEGWRTIMSYNNVCDDAGGYCTRLLYFSNPNNNYSGNPMGVAGTTPANCSGVYSPDPETCVANNASVLTDMAVNNSQFRISQITWTGASSTDWNDANNWNIVQGAANRTSGATSTNVNRVPLAIDDVVIPTGLVNYPTLSGTQNARHVTIQNGASLAMSSGTLNVYGHWDEEGTGIFNGTGGTVVFRGLLPQTITQNAGSNFNNIEVGDGTGTVAVSLGSDLDVNGNLTIQAGASLNGGTQTINVAGNWNEQSATAFLPSTSTVIFDGATQIMDKMTTISVLTEAFNDGIGQGFSTAYIPAGWTRESGWFVGDSSGNGVALAQGDAWLHSSAIMLIADVDYNLTVNFTQSGGLDTLNVFYGTSANSSSQTNAIGTVTTTGTGNFNFTVSSSSTYYIGFFHDDPTNGSSQSIMDNISMSGSNGLEFYNLQISSTGSTTPNQTVAINNNLTTNSGGTLNINGQTLTVEGTVTNNGTLQNILDTPNATTTRFMYIQNEAGDTDKYAGVDITPTGGAMNNTTVQVSGNQNCTTDNTSAAVQRCFDISPATTNAATIRFYYNLGEANGNLENATNIYHWNGTIWNLELGTITRSNGADPRWAQVTNVTNYSPFALDNSIPTAVTGLSQTNVATGTTTIWWMLVLLVGLLGLGTTVVSKRR